MAGDMTTIARPYAGAVFRHAVEFDKLMVWSDMLALLATVMQDQAMLNLVADPKLASTQKADLVLEIGGEHLSEEGGNLVKLLAENGRLTVLPEISKLYHHYKAEHDGAIDVEVATAYVLKPAQEKLLSNALQAKLGRVVNIHSRKDINLIGGFKLRAGDMVIDGSISGQLNQLAHELGL